MESLQQQIEGVVDSILEDYRHGRDIDQMDLFRQPDREIIIDIIAKLRRIVFPGYFRDKNYQVYNARHNLSMLIEDVMFNLSHQIALVLQGTGVEESQAQNQGEQICISFFGQLPKVRELVQTDLQAAYAGDPAATGNGEIIFSYPGLFAIMVYRLAHVLYTLNVPVIPRVMTEHAHSVTGIDIHPGATIGAHFFIDHGTGVVIGETTVIGERVKIYQGVTLGGLSTRGGQSLRGKKRHPTIEDNVTIYANASIFGGETVIGRDSVIGASAFITSSVAPSTRVSIENQPLRYRTNPTEK
jgi:serine O-acetyltransferase